MYLHQCCSCISSLHAVGGNYRTQRFPLIYKYHRNVNGYIVKSVFWYFKKNNYYYY